MTKFGQFSVKLSIIGVYNKSKTREGAFAPLWLYVRTRLAGIFLGLVDPRIASAAYFAIISSITLGGLLIVGGFCPGGFLSRGF